MRMTLSEKRILIVGGTSGFGFEAARQAVTAGAQVHVIGHTPEHVATAVRTLAPAGQQVTGTALDAQDADELTQFLENQPNFDHVLSFLGGAMGGGFLDNSVAAIRQAVEDKFFANLQLVKLAAKHLNPGGSLILTSGAGGHPYDASGAIIGNQAINTLVAGVAVELAPDYRINAVAPTWTPTGLWRQMTPDQRAAQAQAFSQNVPLKRVATVAEVASAYLYLMQNGFVTGQVLPVDGGVDL
ncbi:SDR family oxidoreductase [Levilactobacillus namurensis]|uniref:SDR family oxidoreductase n=1 Tax=Levilactobacillus namurensis TaxID=380393 RepID=UPI0022325921|nr:SDR family oxidoreductase [Levilactobacillus namurensis]MCW3779576.1 SDR family oxidoreductase [Levilactobacillus namurensis]MDT7017753.1 SDR family oxidoreductase [Levilactobacillus namurensis]WNN65245.1 SDR family oxidoreductase [Levilactobacillus namurensis]